MHESFRTKALHCIAAGAITALFLAAPASAQDDGVVARVGEAAITEADLATAAEMYGEQLGSMPEDARRSVLVDALIDMQLATDAARAAGLDQSDGYKRQMAFFEAQTLRAFYMDAELGRRVDDAALRRAYDEQVKLMPAVAENRVSHILLASEADALAVIEALKAGGDFATLAKERSLDEASKANGGDLGFAATGTSLAEIENAVGGLSPGAFNEQPVQSPFGFHVVKLVEARTRPAPSFEALAPQLRRAMEAEATQAIMAELRSNTTVKKLVPDVEPPQPADGDEH